MKDVVARSSKEKKREERVATVIRLWRSAPRLFGLGKRARGVKFHA